MIQSVNKDNIYGIFASAGNAYYSIPKYQREYTWSYKEWDAFYDDISENNHGYFIGSIIYIPSENEREVIDGQQRLTTISLFLAAIYTRLKEYKDYMDEDEEDILSSLRKSLKRSISPNEMVLVPQIQNHNQDDYNFIMFDLGLKKSLSIKHSYFGVRKVSRCYQHFLGLLDNEIQSMNTEKERLKFILEKYDKLGQAMLVKMEVSTHSDAYVLFESLNNRGTPLTAIDLMKNLIMARAEYNNLTTDDCFNRWQQLLAYLSDDYGVQERFFRQYYNAFKRNLNDPFRSDNDRKKDPLGVVATKSNLLNIFEKLINKDLNSFLTDILKCGQYYSLLILQEQDENPYRKNLEDLEHIQGAPSYLLLMYVLKYRSTLELTDADINSLIELLNKYFVRRNVTDYPSTRDLTRIFMDIIAHIEDEMPKGKEVIKVIVKLLGTANNCATDEMFKKSLQGDIYKENVGAARYMLCKLAESAMTQEKWTDLWARTPKNVYVWTIEHIFPEGENIPQSWVDMIADGDMELARKYLNEYTHKIGNLTITGYNSTLGNKSFSEKRDRQSKDGKRFIGYKNGLEINNEIAKLDAWTIDDIKHRSEYLIQQLMEMFKFPSV